MNPTIVFPQIDAPGKNGRFPQGRVAQGAYIVRDGVLIMTDGEGKPIVDNDGRKYTHTLFPNEDPAAIARRFTKEIRKAVLGESKSGFHDPIRYPKFGLV